MARDIPTGVIDRPDQLETKLRELVKEWRETANELGKTHLSDIAEGELFRLNRCANQLEAILDKEN